MESRNEKRRILLLAIIRDSTGLDASHTTELNEFLQTRNACIFVRTSTDVMHPVLDSDKNTICNDEDLITVCNRLIRLSEYEAFDVLIVSDYQSFDSALCDEVHAVLSMSERHSAASPRMPLGEYLKLPILDEISGSVSDKQRNACSRKAREVLPRFSRIPFANAAYVMLNGVVLRNLGGLDEGADSLSAAIADYCLRAGDFGFNAVAANHGYYPNGSEACTFSRNEVPLLQERYPQYNRMNEQYYRSDIVASDYFLDLLTNEFYKKPRLLLEFSDLLPLYNGTVEYQLATIACFDTFFSDVYDIDVLISKDGAAFHQVETQFQHCHFIYELSKRYHIGFSARQPVDIDEQILMNRHCLKIVYTMLDVISLRCDYLRVDWDHSENVRQGLRMCDAVITISDFSRDDYKDYFSDSMDIVKKPVRTVFLGTDFGDGVQENDEFDLPFREYVLVVGNSFKHKALRETIEAVANTHQNYIVVGLGKGDYLYSNIYGYPSSQLSEEFLCALYKNCAVLLFPSLYEGFGLPVIIALKYGKQIVANDNAVNRELMDSISESASNFTFFKEFSQLPAIIEDVTTLHVNNCKAYSRSWDDAIRDVESYIAEVLDMPVDKDALTARWRTVNLIEATSYKSKEQMRNAIGFKKLLHERYVTGHPSLEKLLGKKLRGPQ